MLQSDPLRAQYGYDAAAQLLLLHFSGVSDPVSQISLLETLSKQIPANRLRAVFVDMSNVTGSTSRGMDVFCQNRRAERLTAGKPERLSIAFYAPSDISYGMARMYQGFSDADHAKVEIFDCAAAAITWLDLPQISHPDDLPLPMVDLKPSALVAM